MRRRKWSWPPPSISLRMLLWYSLWGFALIAAASGLLYGVRATSLDEYQDAHILDDYLGILRLMMQATGGELAALPPPGVGSVGAPGEQVYAHVRILDAQGRVLLETPGMAAEIPAPSAAELALWTSEEGRPEQLQSTSGRSFLSLDARVPLGPAAENTRFVQVAIDRTEDEALDRVRDRSWGILSLLVIACALMGYSLMRRGMRPVETMARAVQRIHSRRLDERIDTLGLPKELSGLARTFNEMLDRLEGSFDRISQFSDNVAHELRTPINNLQSEIEVALGKCRTDEDYRQVLGSCLEECTRITRIVHSLLFLAREDTAPSPIQPETLFLREELEAVQDFYEGLAAEAEIRLEVEAPGDLSARLDRTLFRQALSNLVSNAIEHTPSGGRVRMRARVQCDGWVRVAVEDSGAGIAPEHLPRVFERFYRVDGARPGSRRNVGLGLAIVRSIAVRHGGRVGIESQVGVGTTVTLDFGSAV